MFYKYVVPIEQKKLITIFYPFCQYILFKKNTNLTILFSYH